MRRLSGASILTIASRWELPLLALLTVVALLLLADKAHGNFVYWANSGQTTIGRAKLNGTGVNNAFVAGLQRRRPWCRR